MARTAHPGNDRTRQAVTRIFRQILAELDLGWQDVTLYCVDTVHPTDSWTAADTDAMWQYRQARINVYLPTVANHVDADLRAVLMHELVHVLINPMESLTKEKHTAQCELAVENVTRALLKTSRTPRTSRKAQK